MQVVEAVGLIAPKRLQRTRSYDDWAGIVYPAHKPRGFKPLAYLARYFNALEVNTSFYRIPTARLTAS